MKRTDLKKIMIIGSGPIVIGQGCEFDYSGVQACKALKAEGFEVVLVNSNPATIMTDPGLADRTYVEPLTTEVLHEIIRRERPDALLPTLGGQTALNLAMELEERRLLSRYQVELIGAGAEAIRRAEDRNLFKETMLGIGLEVPQSGSAHTPEEARAVAKRIGRWPLIIRPGFTLGGTGGGIARDMEEFEAIVARGLDASLNHEVLVEESLVGWKEFELEVVRDGRGASVVVCSVENIDPMGVHTGDSVTVAPAMTLSDREYQAMRTDSLRVMEAIGVETGGSNVQWAVNPRDGRRVIVEMNPRVSRSSALASKATGFPIAKVAALLAVGYTLDELRNDITRTTPACFEPALDYVVVKVPRFAFEKFPAADGTLGTQMKSVGEAMAIGRSFEEAFEKAFRSLETGRAGWGADGKDERVSGHLDDEALAREVGRPSAERFYHVHEAFRRGWSVERVAELSLIDPFFLRKMEGLVRFEEGLRERFGGGRGKKKGKGRGRKALAGGGEELADAVREAMRRGFSDRQVAWLLGWDEREVRAFRRERGIVPAFGVVDTCAGEFAALTPYYYSAYVERSEPVRRMARRRKGKILILGGGPNRIGQGIEFDYCCCHACFALREAGYETVMMNSNPETVSTDYDTSDRLYFEPVTTEDVLNVYEREKCDGVIVQLGGQTPLNIARELEAEGVRVLGTAPEDIERANDRDFFRSLCMKIGLRQPRNGIARNVEDALRVAQEIGYPVLVRPSYVLGGRAMVIVYKEKYLRRFVEEAAAVSEGHPILIDKFLEHAQELDVDCISDGTRTVVGAVEEHVEPAGIHSGDAACSIPARTLSKQVLADIHKAADELARELKVRGLMNIQLAVKDGEIYMIEVNPRASRTVPFVSKSVGVPLAKLAALVLTGRTLEELHFTREVIPPYDTFKEAVFPFVKFPGVDITLTPEMRSTGEVMGIDFVEGAAYLKSQRAAGNAIPTGGGVFVSLRDEDKEAALGLVRELRELGYVLYATRGTATFLYEHGVEANASYRINEGRPNPLDLMREKKVRWIVNTSEDGPQAMIDGILMRSGAVALGVPVTTTLAAFREAMEGLAETRNLGHATVCSLQEYHRRLEHEDGCLW